MLRNVDVISNVMISHGSVPSQEWGILEEALGHQSGQQIVGGPTRDRERSWRRFTEIQGRNEGFKK